MIVYILMFFFFFYVSLLYICIIAVQLKLCLQLFQGANVYGGSFIYHLGEGEPLVALGMVVSMLIVLCATSKAGHLLM